MFPPQKSGLPGGAPVVKQNGLKRIRPKQNPSAFAGWVASLLR